MSHRDDFSVTPSPIPTLIVIGFTLAILFYLATVCGVLAP